MSDSVWPRRQQPTRLPRPWDSPGKNSGVGCHFLLQCMKVKSESEVAQSCLTLRDPVDCSPPGSSIYGIFQARVLEWGAIAFSKIALFLSHLKQQRCLRVYAAQKFGDQLSGQLWLRVSQEGVGTCEQDWELFPRWCPRGCSQEASPFLGCRREATIQGSLIVLIEDFVWTQRRLSGAIIFRCKTTQWYEY